MSKKTVAQLLLEQLELWGVERIYGVVGDAILGLMDALAQQDKIKFIAVKHESVAAMMASAEAKLTGKLGVCTATMGPGLGNLLNGLGDAYLDQAPVFVITGQAPERKIGTDFKQYIDQQEFIKPLAQYTTLLAHPDSVIEVAVKAMHLSLVKGAVTHLSIPKDLFAKESNAKVQKQAHVIKGKAEFETSDLDQVFSVMENAKKPIILAGLGAKNAVNKVVELGHSWGAGILVSLGAKGFFPNDAPMLIGGIGQGGNPHAKELLKQSDVVLLVGDTWWPDGYVPKDAHIIQIETMRENIGKGIPVEYGIFGNSEDVVPLLAKRLQNKQKEEAWLSLVREAKQKWDEENEQEGRYMGEPLHPSRIVRAIENCVQDDAIISIDTGDVTVWMNRNFRPKKQWMLFSGQWRTMGFGLPGAMAAKLCRPEKQVLAVVGDGGLEMALADLLTAKRYGLDLTVIVFNNQTLQMEKDKMIVSDYAEIGVSLTNPDFVKIAEACGWKGMRVDEEKELEKAISEGLSSEGPVLIEIDTAAVVHPETKG